MTNTIIDLIRHGEPLGGRCYRGHGVDDALSEKGWQQMWQAVEGSNPWQHIVTSPLKRCSEFASALADRNKLSLDIDDNLKEIGFGEWEGLQRDVVENEHAQAYIDFYNDPVNARPKDAEAIDQFIARTTRSFRTILDLHQGKHLLIVSHAGVIRAIIAHTLHAAAIGLYRVEIKNAGITRIKHNGRYAELQCLNASTINNL